jgi:hypothetical protein
LRVARQFSIVRPPKARRLPAIAQAPHPPHEGEERCTDGFSSEKFAEVKIMETSALSLKRAAAAPAPQPDVEPNGSEILVRCLQAENVR